VSKSLTIAVALLVLNGCQEGSDPVKLCIASDLGTYRQERIVAAPPGCEALYIDSQGRKARVRVIPGRTWKSPDGGVLFPFEKHTVYSLRQPDGVRVVWHRGDLVVDMFLEGLAVPQGAVLRAYLFEYRSDVTEDVETAKAEVDQLKESSRSRPKDAAVHLELARKYRKLNDTVMATQEYHIAVDADRSCYDCYLEMGTLYFELKHWDLAIRALRRAAALRPKAPRPALLLGDVYYHVRNGQEAQRAYTQALKLGPGGDEKKRIEGRLAELKDGKYMIEVMPGARNRPKNKNQ
jgi:tetratricopeptide (TPR) repeat protein